MKSQLVDRFGLLVLPPDYSINFPFVYVQKINDVNPSFAAITILRKH